MNFKNSETPDVYNQIKLTDQERELCAHALRVRKNAQAPYSGYTVGAAVLACNGSVYIGCNVERCTLSQTTHAEQNAIDNMIAQQGSSKITAIAFAAASKMTDIVLPDYITVDPAVHGSPCGHCLQIIWENCYGDAHVKIIAVMPDGRVGVTTIGQALPMRFGPLDLGITLQK